MDRTGWNVYQGKDAGMPHLFEAEKWYFSPIEDVARSLKRWRRGTPAWDRRIIANSRQPRNPAALVNVAALLDRYTEPPVDLSEEYCPQRRIVRHEYNLANSHEYWVEMGAAL